MNILFLTTHLNPGGITSYLLTLTRELKHRGHQVFLVSGGGSMEGSFQSRGAKTTTLSLRTKSELDPRIYLSLIPLTRFVKEHRIDIIHAQTRVTQVAGKLLGKITGKPYVATCHGFFKPRWSRKLCPCWGDGVIAISPAVKEHLKKDFGVRDEKIFLVPHGVDLEHFPTMDAQARQRGREALGIGSENLAIGIIARLSDVKGHDVLIESMAMVVRSVPNAKLLIVGEGKTEGALKTLVDDLELDDYISFHPIVDKTAEIFPLLDVFVMPSRQEGLGLSVIEAQACGVPVIASKVGGLTSLIEDGVTGLLVPPGDMEVLGQALIKILSHAELRTELGQKGRDFICQEHTLDKMINGTEEVYQKVMR